MVLIAASRAATQEHDQQDDGENNAAYYPLVDPVIFPVLIICSVHVATSISDIFC